MHTESLDASACSSGSMSDVFHTFFGIGGLSLLGWRGYYD
jgi:hypothetical protein